MSQTATFSNAVDSGIEALQRELLRLQHPDGYWCGELECDITPTADSILLARFLKRNMPSKTAKAAKRILSLQNEDGSWSIYHGGPGDISATVKGYFALKLAGHGAAEPRMQNAARFIRGRGGVDAANTFMKFYLALFGQWPWARVPAMPPELFLLPASFPFNIYAMSSWTRAIVIPMFLLYARKPLVEIAAEQGISELIAGERCAVSPKKDPWTKFFHRMDFLLKGLEKFPLKPWRNKAMRLCRDWILGHLPLSQGLGSIWPAMINAVMALSLLEFPDKKRILEEFLREIDALSVEEEDTLRVQPCWSPVWDTAIAVLGLREAGLSADDPSLLRAGEWILSKEVRRPGDWARANPEGSPGGWYFQFANEFYPDTDDTAMVLMALHKLDLGPAKEAAMNRAVDWLLSMQNRDGGWGAFDKDNDKEFLTKVPFSDHNAMIDPSSCDVTARILEAIGTLGQETPAAGAGFSYLRQNAETDGTWFGRWGVNYIYGTWAVSNAARAWAGKRTGLDLAPALDWLRSCQNADGGWGESCASYDDPRRKGRGTSTASQTAWALLTFFNAGVFEDAAVEKGVAWLAAKVGSSGAVQEPEFTGTGFPRVFYLNYHLYRLSFPLMALSRYREHRSRSGRPAVH